MPANVEIKVRLCDPAGVAARLERLAAGPPQTLDQRAVFYLGAAGRLTLRYFPDGTGELIQYDRPDRPGPKTSHFRLYRTAAAAELAGVLDAALPRAGEVCKRRRLYLVGRTRVHLDRVEGLGDFLELEVVLAPGESPDQGERETWALLADLGVAPADLVAGAYVDLLAGQAGSQRS